MSTDSDSLEVKKQSFTGSYILAFVLGLFTGIFILMVFFMLANLFQGTDQSWKTIFCKTK